MGGFIINDKVSIVLLNWNGHEDTVECLKSLINLNYQCFDIYLVDNDSEKSSIDYIGNYLNNQNYYSFDTIDALLLDDYIKEDNINLLFILNDNNAGFAGGNNVALEYLINNKLSDYVLLLNNDTVVSKDFLDALLDKIKQDDDIGFVGCTHYYYDNPESMQTVGGGCVDLVHGECSAVRDKTAVEDYDFITGSCILMSIGVLRDLGVMDTGYFMYWEDVDWSTCAREKSYKLKVSDYGCIYHKEGSSIKSLNRIYYHTRNRILYMKRHTTGLIYYKFLIYILCYVGKESFFNIVKDYEYSKTLIKALISGIKAK